MDEPSHADLEAMAWREIDDLPEEFRSHVSNLDVVIADEPPKGKNWLATYQGHPLTQLPRLQTWGGRTRSRSTAAHYSVFPATTPTASSKRCGM